MQKTNKVESFVGEEGDIVDLDALESDNERGETSWRPGPAAVSIVITGMLSVCIQTMTEIHNVTL